MGISEQTFNRWKKKFAGHGDVVAILTLVVLAHAQGMESKGVVRVASRNHSVNTLWGNEGAREFSKTFYQED
jgi:hypothetical protein